MQSDVFEDEDSINCGRCGQTFRSFDVFKSHKLACPMPRAAPITDDVVFGTSTSPPHVDDAACADDAIDAAAPIVPLSSGETLDADALTPGADIVGACSKSIDAATLSAEADTSATSLPPVHDLSPDVFGDASLLQQPEEQDLQHHSPQSQFHPKPPQPDPPVVYFNNAVLDRSVLSSLLGVSESEIDVDNIGLSAAVNYPPIEIISTTADAPVLIPSSTSHVDLAQYQLKKSQQLLQTTLQQPLPYHDVIATFAVNEEDITHLSALVNNVNNGLFASQDFNVSSSSSIPQNVNEMRTLRPIAPLLHLTTDLGGGGGVTPSDLSPRKVPWRRSSEDSAIAVVNGGMWTAKLTVDQSNCSRKSGEADDAILLSSKSLKKPRNKVMRLPAKNPLNLTAKSRNYSESGKSSGRAKTGGVTMTQTQTTRIFKLHCPYCQKLFCKRFDLDAHVRSHTGEKPFQCCICGKCFSQKSNVKKHLTTHKVWPEGRVSMPLASSRLEKAMAVEAAIGASNSSLNASNSSLNSSNSSPNVDGVVESLLSSYFCQFCDEKFPHWPKLSSHLAAVHKDRQVFKCRVLTCPATFLEASDLIEHLSGQHDPAEIKYGCEECGIEFDSLRDLGLHHYQHVASGGVGVGDEAEMEDRDDDDDDDDDEEECAQGSIEVPNFGKSLSKKSSSSAKYICSYCGDKFSRDETLKAHLATVSHSFPCPICSVSSNYIEAKLREAVFPSERILRKHVKECHAASPHVCSHCSKTCKTKALLNVHMKAHGPSTFECEDPLCKWKFKRKDQLARHRKSVHGKRRYSCPHKTICSQRFGRRDQLRIHLQHAHESRKERRPWKCGDCGKGFLTKHHLAEHERIHGDNRRFRCLVCGRGFSRQKQMDVHLCENPGRRWKGEEKKENETSWRRSTLLRSGRKTKPTKRPDEAGFEELDRAFQPVVVETRNPDGVATESSVTFGAVVDDSFALDNDVVPRSGMGVN